MVQPNVELSISQPPPVVRLAYNPPQYLLSSSGLSRNEFVAQYEAFTQSLEYIQIAPELVFERLFGNLQSVFNGALIREQANHGAAEVAWRREKTALQADLDRATLAEKESAKLSLPSHPVVASPGSASTDQTYLQFWHSSNSSDCSAIGDTISVHVAATMAPIPYGLASSWPGMESIRTSAEYGTYDSRMDALLWGSALPAIDTHIVHFKQPFPAPPIVMVWLTGLSAARHDTVCVNVTAHNVNESGFALQINSSGGACLGSVGVAWAVWSPGSGWSEKPGLAQGPWPRTSPPARGPVPGITTVGSVNTVAPAAARVTNLNTAGVVPVTGVMFVALSAVDLVLGERLWIDVQIGKHSGVNQLFGSYQPQGLAWNMSAGPVNATVYSARVVYATGAGEASGASGASGVSTAFFGMR